VDAAPGPAELRQVATERQRSAARDLAGGITAQLNACPGGVKWRQGDHAMPAYLDEEFWDEVDAEADVDHPLIEFV
jgi:hypothetical protein